MNLDNMKANEKNNGMWTLIPDMKEEKKKVEKIDMLTTGIGSIFFGIATQIFMPAVVPVWVFYLAGGEA